MITLKNLSKIYQINGETVHALQDINLTVKPGEIFGVIGESGAGKSTLVRCINLLEKPSSGQIYLGTQELTALPIQPLREARRQIGKIFQHFNLLSSRTVFDNVAFPLELLKKPKTEIKKRVDALLSLTGLTKRQSYYPSQLSGGQKQRVAIARALACEPKVLLCDEATSALDPQTTHGILNLLNEINKTLGLTIIIITHEMDVVKQLCHRVGVLDQGKLVEQNALLQFLSDPKTLQGEQFVNSCLRVKLPDAIQSQLISEKQDHHSTLLTLHFQGQQTESPIIYQLIQQYNLEVNILQANIEYIRDELIGIMIVQLTGDPLKQTNAIEFLHQHHVKTKVIGYV